MKMKSLGFIGNFGDKTIIGGQIAKTRELYAAILRKKNVPNDVIETFLKNGISSSKEIPDDIFVVDLKLKNPFLLFFKILRLFSVSKNIIIIMSSISYFKLLPLFVFFNKIYKQNMYEFVIGGTRHERLGKKELLRERQMTKIFVESTFMQSRYHELGLKNAVYMPNFKRVFPISKNEIANINDGVLKCCTYSRIDSKKGFDVALEIMRLLNKEASIKTEGFSLDIIGPVDAAYKSEFESLMKNCPCNVRYIGAIDGNTSKEVLKNYNILVFPTCWENEGFPGSFIDAMQAALVILATEKENFKDIVKDGKNGWLLPERDAAAYVQKLIFLHENAPVLQEMQGNSLLQCMQYDTDSVLKDFLEEIL